MQKGKRGKGEERVRHAMAVFDGSDSSHPRSSPQIKTGVIWIFVRNREVARVRIAILHA